MKCSFLNNLLITILGLSPLSLFLGFSSCKSEEQKKAEEVSFWEEGEDLSAGKLTSYNTGLDAFGEQVPGVTAQQLDDFVIGNSFFKTNWVTAPASATARDGLGPFLNAKSCSACHAKDGRGSPPDAGDTDMKSLLFRLSVDGADANGAPIPHPNYGGQLQSSAILGLQAEGQPLVQYTNWEFTYPDGSKTILRRPNYTFNTNYGDLGSNTMISPRVGLQICGMGLLEAISESDILARVDVSDANNDGVSGKANYVYDHESETKKIGRFGWKANQPTLKQQVAGAFNGDIGITSTLFPNEDTPSSLSGAVLATIPGGGVPEVSDIVINQVTLYCQTLAVPVRRNSKDKDVLNGRILFQNLGCNQCHTQKYTTSAQAQPSVLANVVIRPYTDLLLHDMGDDLADNRPDFDANGKEWRTTPLWGIGLINTVNNHTFLLHDGRARNVEEAILWHGGEALNHKNKFTNLSKSEREQVIKFINSL